MKKIKTSIARWLISIAKKLSKDVVNPTLDPKIALCYPPIVEKEYDIRKAQCVQSVPKHIIDGIIESEREEMLQSIIRNVKQKFLSEINLEDVMECEKCNSDDGHSYLIKISLNILAPKYHG